MRFEISAPASSSPGIEDGGAVIKCRSSSSMFARSRLLNPVAIKLFHTNPTRKRGKSGAGATIETIVLQSESSFLSILRDVMGRVVLSWEHLLPNRPFRWSLADDSFRLALDSIRCLSPWTGGGFLSDSAPGRQAGVGPLDPMPTW